METHHMMGIHHVENSDRNKTLSLSWIFDLIPKFAVAQFMRSESEEEEKFPTAGFVKQNFPDKARKLQHRQIRDKCA